MNNIDIYYESIKQVYEQIKKWQRPKPPLGERVVDSVLIFAIVIFIASLIPVIPILYVIIGGKLNLSLYTISLSNASIIDFVKVWVGIALITLIFMVLMILINNKVDAIEKEPVKPPQSLSPEQLTFIAVYESYKELKIFFVSHVEQHIDNSRKALSRVLPHPYDFDEKAFSERQEMIFRDDDVIIEQVGERRIVRSWRTANLIRQVEVASSFLNTFEKYAWFQLDTQTKSTLQALISFSEKMPHRLKDKQDLPRVLSVLENLSKFTYAYLPEHNTYMESTTLDELHSDGAKCLGKFAQEVNELTSYKREEQPKRKHEIPPTIVDKVKGKFNENVFFRFSVWFLLIIALTSGAVALINQRVTLSPDTMVTIIITTSVASAAALAGFLPVKK